MSTAEASGSIQGSSFSTNGNASLATAGKYVTSNSECNGYKLSSLNAKAINGVAGFGKVMDKVDDDIVILDDNPGSEDVNNAKKLLHVENANNSATLRSATASSPKSKFEINDKMRNSLKDLIFKVQDSSPALSTLLSGTKVGVLPQPVEKKELDKTEKNGRSVGNLFDNLKAHLPCPMSPTIEKEKSDKIGQKSEVKNMDSEKISGIESSQEVILLDEPDDNTKSLVNSKNGDEAEDLDKCEKNEHVCDNPSNGSSDTKDYSSVLEPVSAEKQEIPDHDLGSQQVEIGNNVTENAVCVESDVICLESDISFDKEETPSTRNKVDVEKEEEEREIPKNQEEEKETLNACIKSEEEKKEENEIPNACIEMDEEEDEEETPNTCIRIEEDEEEEKKEITQTCINVDEEKESEEREVPNTCIKVEEMDEEEKETPDTCMKTDEEENEKDASNTCINIEEEKAEEEEAALLSFDEKDEKSSIDKIDQNEEEILLASSDEEAEEMDTKSADIQTDPLNSSSGLQAMDVDGDREDDHGLHGDMTEPDPVEVCTDENQDSSFSCGDVEAVESEEKGTQCQEESDEESTGMEELENVGEESNMEPDMKEELCEELKDEKSSDLDIESELKVKTESKDRKRPADWPQDTSVKRSRLETRTEKCDAVDEIQSDDTSDSKQDAPGKEVKLEDRESDDSLSSATLSSPEDYMKASPTKGTGYQKMKLTEKELEMLVRVKVKEYLHAEKLKWMQEMNTKLTDLYRSKEEWKKRYKKLEKEILDVTILQQTHEKRKAKTAALRQISTKNIGTQVDEVKIGHVQPGQQKTPPRVNLAVNGVGTPPKTVSSALLPAKSAPNLIVTPVFTVANGQLNTQLVPVPTIKTPAQLAVASGIAAASAKLANKQALNSATVVNSANVAATSNPIGNKIIGTNVPQGFIPVLVANTPTVPAISRQVTAVSTVNKKDRIIDLTNEEESKKILASPTGVPILHTGITGDVKSTLYRPTLANSSKPATPSSGGIILNSPNQLIRTSTPQTIQLVFNTTSPAIRPGSIVNVVTTPPPIMRPMAPTAVMATSPAAVMASVPAGHTPLTGQAIQQKPRQPPPLKAIGQLASIVNTSASNVKPVVSNIKNQVTASAKTTPSSQSSSLHPAPLPKMPPNQVKSGQKPLPPKPSLKISRVAQGIVLSWNMVLNATPHADIQAYQLFAYQEGHSPPNTNLWKKVGDVKALPLPMACTLTQFQEGNKYHFAVRAVDIHGRLGPFSDPNTIHLKKKS